MSIVVNVDPLSMRAFHCEMLFNKTQLSIGTCFTYQKNERIYLITNWHNVTGRNSLTKEPLSATGGIPNTLGVMFPSKAKLGAWEKFEIPLYYGEDENLRGLSTPPMDQK